MNGRIRSSIPRQAKEEAQYLDGQKISAEYFLDGELVGSRHWHQNGVMASRQWSENGELLGCSRMKMGT